LKTPPHPPHADDGRTHTAAAVALPARMLVRQKKERGGGGGGGCGGGQDDGCAVWSESRKKRAATG